MGAADAAIVFQNEVAAFKSTLGVYLIGEGGEIIDPKIVFPLVEHAEAIPEFPFARPGGGPLEPGDQVLLSELYSDQLAPGVEFGLFLIGDGFALNGGLLGGELRFVDAAGEPATIFDPAPQLVAVTEGGLVPVRGNVFHTADPTPDALFDNPLNPGGEGQALAGFVDGRLWVSFEDKPFGTDDDDFNDAVFTIEPVDPGGTSLVFQGLTPALDDILAGIVADPPGVERVPQVTPGDIAAAEVLTVDAVFDDAGGEAAVAPLAAGPPPQPSVLIDPGGESLVA